MADLATLQTRLTEAESAYHKLMTGSQAEMVSHSGTMTKYTAATMADLSAYIEQLKAQVAAAGGTISGSKRGAFSVDLSSLT